MQQLYPSGRMKKSPSKSRLNHLLKRKHYRQESPLLRIHLLNRMKSPYQQDFQCKLGTRLTISLRPNSHALPRSQVILRSIGFRLESAILMKKKTLQEVECRKMTTLCMKVVKKSQVRLGMVQEGLARSYSYRKTYTVCFL